MEFEIGENIFVPEFTYKGRKITDLDDRHGILKTCITSADKKVKYYKVKLFRKLGGVENIIVLEERGGKIIVPEVKRKTRRRRSKTDLLPIFDKVV